MGHNTTAPSTVLELWNITSVCAVMAMIIYLVVVVMVTLNLRQYFDVLKIFGIGQHVVSALISYTANVIPQCKVATMTIRSTFSSSPLVKNVPKANHTHASSAANRNAAASHMEKFSLSLGFKPYFVQKSPSDVRSARDGCRTYYWAKDVGVDYEAYCPGKDHMVVLVDVDMYVNLPDLIAMDPRPYVMHTFQPSQVCRATKEYSYTFDEDDNVVYNVTGGAKFTHPVWDYSADVIIAKTSTWFGLIKHFTCYNVDRRQVDDDHQLILLTPIKSLSFPLIDLSGYLSGHVLTRLKVVEDLPSGKFLRLDIMSTEGRKRSTSVPHAYVAATIPVAMDDALAATAVCSTTPLNPFQVKSILRHIDESFAEPYGEEQGICAMLANYHRNKCRKVPSLVYPIEESVYRYQLRAAVIDDDAKPSLQPFMNPLALGCYAPDQSRANDKAMVDGRIEAQKNSVQIDSLTVSLMKEFIEMLVPADMVGTYSPMAEDEVYSKQKRPTQRHILAEASALAGSVDKRSPIKSFMKKEAGQKPADPRAISTLPGKNKLNYARFIYVVDKLLMMQKWSAMGKSPRWIAERIAFISMHTEDFSNKSDFERMDGKVSEAARELERMLLMRMFHPKYHAELSEILATQTFQQAVTTFGIKYNTGNCRASGSNETSCMNTMFDAFIAYCAFRTLSGKVLSPAEVWNEFLGIYLGDDGYTRDLPVEHHAKWAAKLGQKLDAAIVKRGDYGVDFLARIYSPFVWFGAPDSMCDVKRQLLKLHTTVALPPTVTPLQKLGEKCAGYLLSDPETPILGEIAQRMAELHPDAIPGKLNEGVMRGVANWAAVQTDDPNEQYPNENNGGWMETYVHRNMPEFDLVAFRTWLRNVRAETADILRPPLFASLQSVPHNLKREARINGDLVLPLKSKPEVGGGSTSEEKKDEPKDKFVFKGKKNPLIEQKAATPGVCTHFAKGRCTRGDKCKFSHVAKQA